MIICPNLSNPQVKQEFDELVEAVGEVAAYDIWSQNNVNSIDKAPNGAESKLFSDLLQHYNYDRVKAIQAKAKIFSKSFKNWFGDWLKPTLQLKPGDIVFGHPAIGKTYSVEQGIHSGEFIDWDVEYNRKRDEWIEQHSNTKKGTPEYKKARNEYLIYPERHPDYMKFLTDEWDRVKQKAKKENKILIASPHTLLKHFTKDFNYIINLDKDDFIERNIGRGGDEKGSRLWKEGIDNTLSNIHDIPVFTLRKGQYFEDLLNDQSNVSKVVDDNGEPFLAFHQREGRVYPGHYFTVRKKYGLFNSKYTYVGFLNFKNPAYVPIEVTEEVLDSDENVDAFIKSKGYDSAIGLHPDDDSFYDKKLSFTVSSGKYFGFPKEFVMFDANQFKSIDNTGEFSKYDNNIYDIRGVRQRRSNLSMREQAVSTRISNLLQNLFPEISVKYVDSIEGGYLGQIDLDALQILINVNEAGLDTLPHEYAHYYIDMFRDTDIVKQGFEQFGGEENLVQAIGEQVVAQEGKTRSWWKKFTDYVKKLLNKNKYGQQALLAELTDAFLTRSALSDRESSIKGIRYQTKKSISQVRDTFTKIQSNITFDPDSHSYYNKETGAKLESVSSVKEKLGYSEYDSANEDQIQAALSEDARVKGTAIHGVFEAIWLGKFDRILYKDFSDEAIDGIRNVVTKLKKQYDFVASEQMIADFDKNIAGTADLILQDKKTGEYVLMDFKTKLYKLDGQRKKPNGRRLYGFNYVNSTKFSDKSTRDGYDFQLSMYQYMMKKWGINISKRAIIPILYELENNKVTNVFVSKTMGGEDIETEGYYEVVETPSTKYDVEIKTFGDNSEIKVSMDYVKSFTEKFTNLSTTLRKQLSKQAELFRLQGRRNQATAIEHELDKFGNMTEVDLLVSYLDLVQDLLKRFVTQIEQRYGDFENATWDLEALQIYYEISNSYDMIDNIAGIVHEFPQTFTKKQIKSVEDACDAVQALQRQITHAYDSKGSDLYMQIISKYVDNISVEYRSQARKEYLKNNPGEVDKQALEKYIDNYIKEHDEEIKAETKLWLERQRRLADSSFEPSILMAHLGSVYSSKDPFVQATVKYFDATMQEADQQGIVWRTKLNNILKRYIKQYGGGNFANQYKLYEDLIEIVDGQAYLVSEIPNSFAVAYKDKHDEIFDDSNLSSSEKKKLWNSWLNTNAPIKDMDQYLADQKMMLEGITSQLTKAEKKIIKDNLNAKPEDRKEWYYFYKKNSLSGDTVKQLQAMDEQLSTKHRSPLKSKYKNEKYDKLMALKESGDVKYELYEFLSETMQTGDSLVQRNLRLNGRLPGIRKTGMERVNENGVVKGGLSAGSNFLKEHSMFREDEDTRNKSFVDLNGKKLNVVPMFFNNRIDVEEQSFDLPTIFGMWYQQTLEYEAKKRIESFMNYTTYVLDTRKTETNTTSLLSLMGKKEEKASKKAENLLNQWRAFMDQVFYGNSEEDLGKIGKIDITKAFKALLKYYSLRVMAINQVSALNNITVGEIQQVEEAIAGRFMSIRSYHRASMLYTRAIPGMLADVGKRMPEHKFNKLVQWFGVFRPGPENMRASGLYRYSITDMAYWTTNVGERELQTRMLLGALIEYKAKDADGNEIGDLLDYIDFNEDGELIVDPKVANFTKEDQYNFSTAIRTQSMYIHGNYDDYMKVAAQQRWYGWAGLMLRKWIVPGYQRRFASKYYDNITRMMREGFYKTGYRLSTTNEYTVDFINFLRKIVSFNKLKKLEATKWRDFEDWEKQNFKAFVTEISFMAISLALYSILSTVDPDDDDEKLWISNLMYQSYRVWNDLSFYIIPTSTARILQDPFPSMNLLDNVSRLFEQLSDPTETYRYGNKKGQNKLWYQIKQFVPGYRQLDRFQNIDEEMELFQKAF